MHIHYFQVDLDKCRRQSKMAANSKSHAVSQMAYAGEDDNFYACGIGLNISKNNRIFF